MRLQPVRNTAHTQIAPRIGHALGQDSSLKFFSFSRLLDAGRVRDVEEDAALAADGLRLREGLARDAVRRLREAGLRVHVLSGDAEPAVAALASRLGIDHARGGATPEAKLDALRALQAGGAVVLMVGDGVNDAPVLGAAQVSIAMGGGTDLARGHADGVLLKEDLTAVADAVDLARATRRVMRQNLGWSIAYNLLALPLAAGGLLTPWLAAIGMSLSSLVVVLNAVKLGKPPRERAAATRTTVATDRGLAATTA